MKEKYQFPPIIILYFFILAYLVLYSYLSYIKYRFFLYSDFDLAVHSQALRSIIHGSTFSSILGKSFLGNHSHFILFFLLPIFYVFPGPMTLLIAQTLALGLSAIVLFKIGKTLLDESWALLIALLYLIYPALGFANLFEFHPTAFALPLFFLIIYFFLHQKMFALAVSMLIASLCQENIPLILSAFCFYALFPKNAKYKPFYAIAAGYFFLWFIFCIYFVIPFFAREPNIYFKTFYPHLGKSISQIALFIVSHPVKVLHIILGEGQRKFLLYLFAPLAFLPLLGLSALIPAIPSLLQHLLSARITEHTIYYHYTLEIIPFIFFALISGIKFIKRFAFFKNRELFFKIIILSIGVFFYVNMNVVHFIYLFGDKGYNDYASVSKQRLLKTIPPDASVIATFGFLPQLSAHKSLYSFHNVLLSKYSYSEREFIVPPEVSFALIDFNDALMLNGFYDSNSSRRIQEFLKDGDWKIFDVVDTIVLFQKGIKSDKTLYEFLPNAELAQKKLDVTIANSIKLLGIRMINQDCSGGICFQFYWQALRDVREDIVVFFEFFDNKVKKRIFSPICYNIAPTYTWKKGQYIKEYKSLIFPSDLDRGTYTLKVGFCQRFGNTIVVASLPVTSGVVSIDDLNRFELTKIQVP